MRILFWSSAFWPSIGGVQVLAAKLLPALEERGFQHLVVTSKSDCIKHEVEYFGGIPVHYFPFWNSMVDIDRLAQTRKQLSKLKRSFEPDLIHINGVSRSDFFHHLTAQVHPAPLLISLHNGWLPEEDEIVKRSLSSASWVVGCSEATLSEGRKLASEINTRSAVIHNGVDVPDDLPKPISFDPPRLLCIGRLVEDKGFDVALDSVVLLLDKYPRLKLTIVGDGPARADLEQQAARLGISGAVHFVGWVDPAETPKLVNSSTVVVVPSRWQEPFGLVVLEAAMMARPVVATDVGGLPEVVVNGQTGLLVEPENAGAVAQAVISLLEQPAVATHMGQVGRSRVLEKFGIDRYVDAYEALYQRLIN